MYSLDICELGGTESAGSGSAWQNQWDQLTQGPTESRQYIKSIYNPLSVSSVCALVFMAACERFKDQLTVCIEERNSETWVISQHWQRTRLSWRKLWWGIRKKESKALNCNFLTWLTVWLKHRCSKLNQHQKASTTGMTGPNTEVMMSSRTSQTLACY